MDSAENWSQKYLLSNLGSSTGSYVLGYVPLSSWSEKILLKKQKKKKKKKNLTVVEIGESGQKHDSYFSTI